MKLLLDTSIVIDYLAHRDPFYADARTIMLLGALGEAEPWVTASQFTDIFYIASEGGRKSASAVVQQRLQGLREFMHVCSTSESHIDEALAAQWVDFEDACIAIGAQKIQAVRIVTRNVDDFACTTIPACSPSELFDALRAKGGLEYEEVLFGA